MAESEGGTKGIGGFLKAQTGPLPNWAWLLVIGGGIVAAFVVPKIFGSQGASSQTSTDQSGQQGLGLAIDPTTGLPYAVEGLVPSGGTVGTAPGQPPPAPIGPIPPVPNPQPTPTPTPYNPLQPLIPAGQYNGPNYSNLAWGTTYTFNGILYQLGTGPGGRLYGVPIVPGQTLTQQQFNAVPIAQGQKVLLTEPASQYPFLLPQTTTSPWNGQQQTHF